MHCSKQITNLFIVQYFRSDPYLCARSLLCTCPKPSAVECCGLWPVWWGHSWRPSWFCVGLADSRWAPVWSTVCAHSTRSLQESQVNRSGQHSRIVSKETKRLETNRACVFSLHTKTGEPQSSWVVKYKNMLQSFAFWTFWFCSAHYLGNTSHSVSSVILTMSVNHVKCFWACLPAGLHRVHAGVYSTLRATSKHIQAFCQMCDG